MIAERAVGQAQLEPSPDGHVEGVKGAVPFTASDFGDSA
jgi:hypothetical protein